LIASEPQRHMTALSIRRACSYLLRLLMCHFLIPALSLYSPFLKRLVLIVLLQAQLMRCSRFHAGFCY